MTTSSDQVSFLTCYPAPNTLLPLVSHTINRYSLAYRHKGGKLLSAFGRRSRQNSEDTKATPTRKNSVVTEDAEPPTPSFSDGLEGLWRARRSGSISTAATPIKISAPSDLRSFGSEGPVEDDNTLLPTVSTLASLKVNPSTRESDHSCSDCKLFYLKLFCTVLRYHPLSFVSEALLELHVGGSVRGGSGERVEQGSENYRGREGWMWSAGVTTLNTT